MNKSWLNNLGEWIDKNAKYIIYGEILTYILCCIDNSLYYVRISKSNFDLRTFLMQFFINSFYLLSILIISSILFILFSKNKIDRWYLCLLLLINVLFYILLFLDKGKNWLYGSYLGDFIIGITFIVYKIRESKSYKLPLQKSHYLSTSTINTILTVAIPAVATVIAALISKH